jgi:hypothetical protein
MSKRKIGIAVAVVLVLIIGSIWAYRAHANAQVEKIRRMQDEMFAAGRPDREKFDQLRKEMEQLSPGQREELWDRGRQQMQRREDKRIAEYFALPPEKRDDFLDKRIQEMEKRRKEWEARRAQDGMSGPGQTGAGQNANAPGQGPNAARAGWQRGGQNATPEAVSVRRNQLYDNTSPEQRAARAAYRSDLQRRRIALGLPPFPGRGPGGR